MSSVTVKVPGKLYLAGEYAVSYPHHSALILAINRFLKVTITASKHDYGYFQSQHYQEEILTWKRKEGRFKLKLDKEQLTLLETIIQTTEEYVEEYGKDLRYYDLKIATELNSPSGKKYGFGSSGALSIGLVKGLLTFYQVPFDNQLAFKLACLAHLKLEKNGSFGDLAASCYSGLILYTCFEKSQIRDYLKKESVKEIVERTWPGLDIQALPFPDKLLLGVAWTGQPASTDQLLSQVHTENGNNLQLDSFLIESQKIVEDLTRSIIDKDYPSLGQAIQDNRKLLQSFTRTQGILYETPALIKAIHIAEEQRAFAKVSGAGGGDCVIALFDCRICKNETEKAWIKANIKGMNLDLYDESKEAL